MWQILQASFWRFSKIFDFLAHSVHSFIHGTLAVLHKDLRTMDIVQLVLCALSSVVLLPTMNDSAQNTGTKRRFHVNIYMAYAQTKL